MFNSDSRVPLPVFLPSDLMSNQQVGESGFGWLTSEGHRKLQSSAILYD